MRVVAYCRVSTTGQAESGLGLEAQRERIRAYAGLYGLEIIAWIDDAGFSGKTLDRPGLARARTLLVSGEAQGLIVAKLDRLSRSVRDLGELVERDFAGAALLSVGEQIDTRTAGGRLVLNVLASVSQWEREAIAERTKAALAVKRTRGEYAGGRVRYGQRVEGDRVARDANEATTIALVKSLRAEGHTLAAIARHLEARGILARNGKRFLPGQIDRLSRYP